MFDSDFDNWPEILWEWCAGMGQQSIRRRSTLPDPGDVIAF